MKMKLLLLLFFLNCGDSSDWQILFDGKIVKTGDKNLALRLEDQGYDWIKQEQEV